MKTSGQGAVPVSRKSTSFVQVVIFLLTQGPAHLAPETMNTSPPGLTARRMSSDSHRMNPRHLTAPPSSTIIQHVVISWLNGEVSGWNHHLTLLFSGMGATEHYAEACPDLTRLHVSMFWPEQQVPMLQGLTVSSLLVYSTVYKINGLFTGTSFHISKFSVTYKTWQYIHGHMLNRVYVVGVKLGLTR